MESEIGQMTKFDGKTKKPVEYVSDKDNKIITVSNHMSRAYWELGSTWEKRLISIVIGKIRSSNDLFPLEQIIRISEVIELCRKANKGSDNNGNFLHIYREIGDVVDRLQNRKVKIYSEASGKFEQHVVCPSIYYDPELKELKICFNEKLRSHILDLKLNFTQFALFEMLKLKSKYSQKLYQFLKSWDDQKTREFDIEYLYKFLGAPESARRNIGIFKRKVFLPAISEIEKQTSFVFGWEIVNEFDTETRRKKASKIKFTFGNKSLDTGGPESRNDLPAIPDAQNDNDYEEFDMPGINVDDDDSVPDNPKQPNSALDLLSQIDNGDSFVANKLSMGLKVKADELKSFLDESGDSISKEESMRLTVFSEFALALARLSGLGLQYTPINKLSAHELLLTWSQNLNENLKELKVDNSEDWLIKLVKDTVKELGAKDVWPQLKDFSLLLSKNIRMKKADIRKKEQEWWRQDVITETVEDEKVTPEMVEQALLEQENKIKVGLVE